MVMVSGDAVTSTRVFVSYRRGDTSPYAGRLYDFMVGRFGEDDVFMDVDSISLGRDFAEEITAAVASCDVLLAIIGPDWLHATDASGAHRLDNPDDYVRLRDRNGTRTRRAGRADLGPRSATPLRGRSPFVAVETCSSAGVQLHGRPFP